MRGAGGGASIRKHTAREAGVGAGVPFSRSFSRFSSPSVVKVWTGASKAGQSHPQNRSLLVRLSRAWYLVPVLRRDAMLCGLDRLIPTTRFTN